MAVVDVGSAAVFVACCCCSGHDVLPDGRPQDWEQQQGRGRVPQLSATGMWCCPMAAMLDTPVNRHQRYCLSPLEMYHALIDLWILTHPYYLTTPWLVVCSSQVEQSPDYAVVNGQLTNSVVRCCLLSASVGGEGGAEAPWSAPTPVPEIRTWLHR
jgi:hypothetical protein